MSRPLSIRSSTPSRFGLGLLAGALALAAALGTAVAAPARRPNIVFIFSDDHSLQTIGAYGGRMATFLREQKVTPNIDRLAARGGLFVNSFCGNSLCSPSRAAILTGLHSHANGVMNLNTPILPGTWTFPESLRDAGYQTAVIGKWHLAATPAPTDFWRLLDGQGTYWHPEFITPLGRVKKTGYATDIITELGVDWLKNRDHTKPFMLMVHHKAPHRNWMPPARYYNWLSNVTIPEPDTLFDDYTGRASPAHNQKMEIGKIMTLNSDLKVMEPGKWIGEFNRMSEEERAEWSAVFGPRNEAFKNAKLQGRDLVRWKYQEYMKDYLRCIKGVDDSVGSILTALKSEGLEDDTIVIYASDQGFYNGEHGWFDKRFIYEESIHMPLIVSWPGVIKPGTRFTQMVQNIDYAETFADITGAHIPEGLHGRSLLPILKGQTPKDWRHSVYYHYYDPDHGVPKHYGIRTERYTLVHFYITDEWELFDLKKDPKQMRSVYSDPSYAKTVLDLKAELLALKTYYKDTSDQPKSEKPGNE